MMLIVAMIAIPAALAVISVVIPSRISGSLTALGGVCTAACIIASDIRNTGVHGPDALSAVFLLPVAIVYGTVGLYTHWYVQAESPADSEGERHRREFLALTNAFACSEIVVPLLTNMGGLWIALR